MPPVPEDPRRTDRATILLAGGGSGGHIFPNLAVIERLVDMGVTVRPHVLVSQRPLDRQIVAGHGLALTALPAQPWTLRPDRWPSWWSAWRTSIKNVTTLIDRYSPRAMVATGGFVSAPALAAAKKAGVPTALVNLDAVPGKANRAMRRGADVIFTAYPIADWPQARTIGYPIRKASVGPPDASDARRQLGMDPRLPMLLVCGGSQGAQSINAMIEPLLAQRETAAVLRTWQVLHLTGRDSGVDLAAVYSQAKIRARVVDFLDRMDLAWTGAELAISRAGAGSVAEAWANATPTIFLPYPFHRDDHQRLNAQPLVDFDAAVVYRDLVDAMANAEQLAGPLRSMLSNGAWRSTLRAKLQSRPMDDGAAAIACWVADQVA